MFLPHQSPEQLKVQLANSAKMTINCLKSIDARYDEIDHQFGKRVHELMHYRSHTVNTD